MLQFGTPDRDMRGPHGPNPRQKPFAPAAFDASQACGPALAASYAQRCPKMHRALDDLAGLTTEQPHD